MDNRTVTSAKLIDHLVRLSSLRKRDDLLGGITLVLVETVAASKVELFGLIHDDNLRFWLPLTRVVPGAKVVFVSDPMRAELDAMIPIQADPDRLACLDRVEMVVSAPSADKPAFVSRFPATLAQGTTI